MKSVATIEGSVRDWLARIKDAPGHDCLYGDFDIHVAALTEAMNAGVSVFPLARIVLITLTEEISHGLRPRLTQSDIFALRSVGQRNGNYVLLRRRDFTGQCGGSHIEMLFELAPTWQQYVTRCYSLLAQLHTKGLLAIDWKSDPLTQEQCDTLSYPLRPKKVEGHRGCWQASFDCRIDDRLVSQLLGDVGFLPPLAEEHYVKCEDYPPDDSILAHPDDQVFVDLLTGIAKSRSPLTKDVLVKFMDDEEYWVRRLAAGLLSTLEKP